MGLNDLVDSLIDEYDRIFSKYFLVWLIVDTVITQVGDLR